MPSPSLIATARSLAVDAVTAEVVRAFQGAGIRSILLKGPTLVAWLYDDGAARYYVDSDLLVRPQDFEQAERVLARIDFRKGENPSPPRRGELPHAEPWHRRRDGAELDLHRTLSGLGVAPEEGWRVLGASTETLTVGGAEVVVLPIEARALLVSLHAAQHGLEKPKPLEDLARALRKAPSEVWLAAAELAAQLHAVQNFAIGLRLLPEGERLADELGLASAELIESVTRDGSPARVALGIERLVAARGSGAKLAVLRREVFPSPAFLRWWSPMARRSRLGLVAAYIWRPLWLLRHLIPSLRAWRYSRRVA